MMKIHDEIRFELSSLVRPQDLHLVVEVLRLCRPGDDPFAKDDIDAKSLQSFNRYALSAQNWRSERNRTSDVHRDRVDGHQACPRV